MGGTPGLDDPRGKIRGPTRLNPTRLCEPNVPLMGQVQWTPTVRQETPAPRDQSALLVTR